MWDASDVDYFVKNLSVSQLVKEINHENDRGIDEIDHDYVKACQLAIDILKTYEIVVQKTCNNQRQPFETIESIKARVDIVAFIGQYVTLKKSGNKFNGVCPFHSEKKGSFFVYPKDQSWHCFGACNTGGDILTFIQKYEHLDIKDAIKRLAN